jgi:formylglycine-generating enzyme required for sulfatase activity
VQPVLDHHCVRCHNGKPQNGRTLPDFSARPEVHAECKSGGYKKGTKFSPSYIALRSYVRAHTIESDIHLLNPCEFHAGTTRLIQLLERGHPGRNADSKSDAGGTRLRTASPGRLPAVRQVELDPEGWDRLVTWIDLNTPYHGTWHEIVGMKKVEHVRDRRREMDKRYAGIDENPEAVHGVKYEPAVCEREAPSAPKRAEAPECPGWPFDAGEAREQQAKLGETKKTIDLGDGVKLEMVRIPAGEFVMGDVDGAPGEFPASRVKIDKPFWIGKFEVTNCQFARFAPEHDSRIEHGEFLQFSTRERGYPVNTPDQPVCRVSQAQAEQFCQWLSEKSGMKCRLPTEAQWEWACRAGTGTPLWYGTCNVDFAAFANLADANLRKVNTYGWGLPSGAVPPHRPSVEGIDDKHRVSAPVGSYGANAWGLHDMAGNVWEWTRTAFRPYPYREDDGRNQAKNGEHVTVRGGSWYDRPSEAGSAARLSYPRWQRVYNVGFRVVCD